MRHCWQTLWPVDFFQATQKVERFSARKTKNTLHKVNEKQTVMGCLWWSGLKGLKHEALRFYELQIKRNLKKKIASTTPL